LPVAEVPDEVLAGHDGSPDAADEKYQHACFGIAFAAVTMTAEFIGIRRGDAAALLLARRWSKVMAALVAEFVVAGLAVLLVAPGFVILYLLQQRHMLATAESDADLRLAARLEPAVASQPRPPHQRRPRPG
jgi:hypothetical protein